MNKRRALIIVLLACVLSFICAFAACNKKNNDVQNVEVTAVTLDKDTVNLQLEAKTTETLTAIVSPDNATNKTVTWTTSAESVATVSDGVVTAVGVGSATITATAGSKSANCTVVVSPAPTTVAVTGVSLDKTQLTLKIGGNEEAPLTATVAPDNATNKTVSWSSSNTEVATVSGGVVTALKEGTATITVTTEDGNKTATCAVTVEAADPVNVPVTGVTLNSSELTLRPNGTATLVATVAPSNATIKTVTWSSSNTAVATVADGVVTAVAEGTATITVTTTDGSKTATCAVTVQAASSSDVAVTDVTLDQTAVTLKVGAANATATLVATVAPSNATIKTV
ncbi:MAG: Ig domain-containing protein, partial [Candidatus Coproplasma sp.]